MMGAIARTSPDNEHNVGLLHCNHKTYTHSQNTTSTAYLLLEFTKECKVFILL